MTELDLFAAAVATADPTARAALLDRECGGNPALRERLEKLLAAHFAAHRLLDPPAAGTRSFADAAPTADPDGTRDRPGPAEAEGTVIAGRYKLRQQIGEGGMGTVWMADQTDPVRRKVAVKLIRVERGQSKTILARFAAERQAIALMDHPHIAKLLDAGTTDTGSPFFVMELVKGVPLNEFCDQHKLTLADRLSLFQQICSAVQHAHQKGVIHRDLKPSNILVESHDGKPVPKVIDFGLAKATGGLPLTEQSMFTAFGTIMGTPAYMAPEQATFNAVDVDTRADVYALGVILYELLTGTTPLTRDTLKKAALDEMLRLVREQEAPTPSSRLSSAESTPSIAASRQIEPQKLGRFVKGELDWITLKALSKDRDRRYESATAMAADVGRFLNHEPVAAGPPSRVYKLRKFVRRNRPQVIAASLVLLALVAGVIGTTVGLLEAKKQERLALAAADEERHAKTREADRAEGERVAKLEAQANEKLAGERLVQVEAEKKRADEEKQIAQAVKDFLQNRLLAQADTRTQADALLKAGGTASEAKLNPTIRELLDRAAVELAPETIEKNFPKQPLVQAAILRTVGKAYRGVGEASIGIPFLTRAVELHKAKLGPDHPETLTSMAHLALSYRVAGRLDLALPLYEEALKRMKAKLGPDHPETLTSMNNLASGYQEAGRLDLALSLLEETLKLEKAKLGPDHPDTLATMNNLAASYWSLKQLDKSVPLFEEVLPLMEKKHGRVHPDTQMTVANLGVNYKDAGRVVEAIPLLEEAYRAAKKFPPLRFVVPALLVAYAKAGKPVEAQKLIDELLADAKKTLPKDSPPLAQLLSTLSISLLEMKEFLAAEPLLREALAIREKTQPNAWNTFNTQSMLGGALLGQKKYKEAEPLLLKGYEGMKARENTIPPQGSTRIPEALDRLVELYTATGKPDEAKKHKELRAKYPTAKEAAPTPPEKK